MSSRLFNKVQLFIAASAMLLVSCNNKDTEDLIIGTWDIVSITHQATGHPDQSMNGISTETFNANEKGMSMAFNKDGSGQRIDLWVIHDSVYIYVLDTTFVGDTFYVEEVMHNVRDTTITIRDTTSFRYLATGNLLNIQEGSVQTNYRIDNIDKQELVITDTNSRSDIYTNDYGRSMQFTYQTKNVSTFRRR